MSRLEYIPAVLEVEQYPPEAAAVIISLDTRMDEAIVE
jgi:hypothetical protein